MTGDWLADGNIEVDIHQLEDFANHIKAELDKNFQPSFKNGIEPFLRYTAHISAPGPIKEGTFFEARHNESKAALGQMMGEAMQGLLALSLAAKSIAAEYANGDALVKATHDDVFDAFNGVDGQKTLNDYRQQGEQPQQNGGGNQNGTGNEREIPKEAKDLDKYFGKDSGNDTQPPGTGSNGQTTIGEGKPGAYTVGSDDENMNGSDVQYQVPK